MLAIRLPQEIESRLSALAEKTGRTKTYYAREAILEYLDDLEIKTLTTNSFQSCWNLFYGVEGRETESCEHLIECFGLTSNDFIEQNCNVRGSFFGLEFQSSIFRNLFLLFLFQL